jgi:hypothetical protein
MFYYACGLSESGLCIFSCSLVMTVVPKVLSAVNVLVPVLLPDVRKPPGTLEYDRVVDSLHIQSPYYTILEEYVPPPSVANSYF